MLIKPQPGILDIEPYKGGLSKVDGKKKIIKLSSNENPFGCSKRAIKAYKKVAGRLHRYPDGSAMLLKKTLSKLYNINIENIVCGAGSDELISLLCQAYAGVGDEIIYSQYGFLMYPIAAKSNGSIPVIAEETKLKADVDAILAKVSTKTKIVFLANPNNPTGSYLTKQELKYLRDNLSENILLVIDAAYAEYVIDTEDYSNGEDLVEEYDNVVMTRTFSKIYGLAALRLGWAYCPYAVADTLNRIRGPFNVSTPAIEAGVAALKDTGFTRKIALNNHEQRLLLTDKLRNIGLKVYPSLANFILVQFDDSRKDAKNANQFLMEHGVIARTLDNYGLSSCLRISIGTTKNNKKVAKLLRNYLQQD